MEITINVKDHLIGLVLIALIVLIIFLIVLVKHTIDTIKNAKKITSDASIITDIAAQKTVDLNEMLGDVKKAIADLSTAIQGKQGLIGAVMNLGKATASVIAYMKNKNEK